MEKIVEEQMEWIRASGLTNMFDVLRVKQIADVKGFTELSDYITEHQAAYVHYLFDADPREAEKYE